MPTKDPNPQLWTLRFKQHKVTVLLFVEQTQSFSSIKADLLDALKERGYTEINQRSLPSDAQDIVLGLPIDKNDPSKGWVGLDIPAMELEDETGSKKTVGGKKSVLNASPVGAGLRDGSLLAFKFRSVDAKKDSDDLDMEDSDWDVVMPSYEEE
ncbi:hypothetical protein MMC26_007494 [Xylographa opegraphella]|nr:hypothetical protein [Xylographa opegraphella]